MDATKLSINMMTAIEIKTFTPNDELVADGVVIMPTDSFVECSIRNLKYRLSFASDDTKEAHFTTNIKEKDTPNACMEIVFYNVPSSLFATPSNVIELGTIEGKKLCLRFSISTIYRDNSSDYALMYNWLIEK